MKKNITGTILGGILTAVGLISSIIGFVGYTPMEKINGVSSVQVLNLVSLQYF